MNKNLSVNDLANRILRLVRRDLEARRLRSVAWADFAVRKSGLSPHQFAQRHVYRGRTQSHLVPKWLDGSVVATAGSVQRIDKSLPGSGWAYRHPLFVLLEDRKISEREVRATLAPYRAKLNGNDVWAFPGDTNSQISENLRVSCHEFDTWGLVRRQDLWGFTALVGLVRLAEVSGNANCHVECSMEMVRALPAAAVVPWLRLHTELLQTCVEQIRRRVVFSSIMFDVAWDVIERQIDDPPNNVWPSDPYGIIRREQDDPILPAHIVGGRQWSTLDDATKKLFVCPT